jgi:HAD superfamily hydrolase (TIGR01490 family)
VNLALFDFDGTITHKDSFTAFVLFAAGARRLVRGTLALAPTLARYHLGQVPAPRVRALMIQHAFAGRAAEEVRLLGERFDQDALAGLIRPRALERIRWHQLHGDRVAVVSASLSAYLGPWCARHGVEAMCSELEHRTGILTGAYAGNDCTGAEKARRVRERFQLDGYREVYAYGDTGEDRELLELSTRRFFRWSAFE